jgi:hypothetical protein
MLQVRLLASIQIYSQGREMPNWQMGIIQLISTIRSLAEAVPEIADLCKTLIKISQEYQNDQNNRKARERWTYKNAAIDAAISDVLRVHSAKAEQHGATDSPPSVQVCRHCGSKVD